MFKKVLFKTWIRGSYIDGQWVKKSWDYSASYGAVWVEASQAEKYKGTYPELHTVDYSLKYAK